MLQVIKAEEVRDGEPRIWIETPQPVMHTESRRDRGCQPCGFAIVDRPAPTPAVDPLATVRAALDVASKATPGRWPVLDPNDREPGPPVWCGANFGGVAAIGPIHYDADEDETVPGSPAYLRAEADSTAIVALRNAAPAIAALADECAAARDRIATLEAELAQARIDAGNIVLSAEDADRIAALLEDPPAPTPAMLALFAKTKE